MDRAGETEGPWVTRRERSGNRPPRMIHIPARGPSPARPAADREERGPVAPHRGPLGPVLDLMRALWAVNHALESRSRRMNARYGVTGPERMVVRLVGRYPGISAGELAHLLHVHPSTLTGLLKRLVRRGLLLRRADALDGRRALLMLTAKGAIVDRIERGTLESAVASAVASLPEPHLAIAMSVLAALARELDG